MLELYIFRASYIMCTTCFVNGILIHPMYIVLQYIVQYKYVYKTCIVYDDYRGSNNGLQYIISYYISSPLFSRYEQRAALKERQRIERMLIKGRKIKKRKRNHDNKSRILRAKEPKETKTTRAIDELKAVRTADRQRKAERKNVEPSNDASGLKKQPLEVSEVFSADEDEDEGER